MKMTESNKCNVPNTPITMTKLILDRNKESNVLVVMRHGRLVIGHKESGKVEVWCQWWWSERNCGRQYQLGGMVVALHNVNALVL